MVITVGVGVDVGSGVAGGTTSAALIVTFILTTAGPSLLIGKILLSSGNSTVPKIVISCDSLLAGSYLYLDQRSI